MDNTSMFIFGITVGMTLMAWYAWLLRCIEVPKLRKSAKHALCLLNVADVCAYRDPDETTVLCYPPSDVNGGGTKSDDFCGVTGCYACHQVIDGHMKKPNGEWMTAEEKEFYWRRGMQRQWRVWEKGLIKT